MATDIAAISHSPSRRRWLIRTVALVALSAARSARADTLARRLIAAWDDADGGHWVGELRLETGSPLIHVTASMQVPTRAHGLLAEPDGGVIALARRPGQWMLRWHADHPSRNQWLWSEPDRSFNGHAWADADVVLTVETKLDDGHSVLVRRAAQDLAVQAEWPTHGVDAHAVIADADGSLLVANGGVLTLPETGRAKQGLDRMVSTLVRLDPRSGDLLGQWRLDDPRLSLRHLARHPNGTLGVALQAQHDERSRRAGAPLLALFDGKMLRAVTTPVDLAGYGGDIVAMPDGFSVSAPRAGGIARYTVDGRWLGLVSLPEACALAGDAGLGNWFAGGAQVLDLSSKGISRRHELPALRLDNHWLAIGG